MLIQPFMKSKCAAIIFLTTLFLVGLFATSSTNAKPAPSEPNFVPISQKNGTEVECEKAISGQTFDQIKKEIEVLCSKNSSATLQLVLDFRKPRGNVCTNPEPGRWDLKVKDRTSVTNPGLMIIPCGGISGPQERAIMKAFSANQADWLKDCKRCQQK
jgi:hypothetical protein